MNIKRSFVCEDCREPTTRYRETFEPLVCRKCAELRGAAFNAETAQDAVKRKAATKAARVKLASTGQALIRPPAPAHDAPLTGRSNVSVAEAFADLNRQERERAGAVLNSGQH